MRTVSIIMTIIISTLIMGCQGSPYMLNSEELKLQEKIAKDCKCKAEIIGENGVNRTANKNTFIVDLNFNNSKKNLCSSLDSINKVNLSKKYLRWLLRKDLKLLKSHDFIEVHFYSSDKSIERLESPTCRTQIKMALKDSSVTDYFYNPYD